MLPHTSSQETLIIRPSSRSIFLSVKEMFAARYMFWNLVKSSALSPYADMAVGFFWTFLRPLIFLLVITFIRKQSNAQMGETVEYALFVYSGLILWWYFVDATKQAARSFSKYRGLVTKIYYPKVITPAVPVFARLFDLGLQLLAALPLMLLFNHFPDWNIALLPLVIVHVMVVSLALGYVFSIFSSFLRDFERILDFLLYTAFFVSPVIFSAAIVPQEYLGIYNLLNPMAVPLEVFRAALFSGGAIAVQAWILAADVALAGLVAGLVLFMRFQDEIAERVS